MMMMMMLLLLWCGWWLWGWLLRVQLWVSMTCSAIANNKKKTGSSVVFVFGLAIVDFFVVVGLLCVACVYTMMMLMNLRVN